jgi:hypothetical protein
VIVWLNGPFGVGKTAVARALLDAQPGWSILDPEPLGVELLRSSPGTDDFQDLPAWRTGSVEAARERCAGANLVIPMTVWRLGYYREILDGLKALTEVRPFRLTASERTIQDRIANDEPDAAAWRTRHLRETMRAFDDTEFGDHVGTEGRTPAEIARLILVTLGRA